MRHTVAAMVLFALVLPVPPAGAEVTVRLAALPGRPPTTGGLLPVLLTVADPRGELPGAARAVSIRRTRGGPTIWYAAGVAPGSEQSFEVLLPVLSAQETYRVRLLAGTDVSAPAAAEAVASLEVADLAAVERARNALVDPAAYDGRLEDLPRWPAWLLRTVFLAGTLLCLALAGALLVRRPAARLAASAVVVGAGSLAMAYLLAQCPVVLTRQAQGVTVLTCRRTASWSCPARGVGAVYWSPARLDADDMIYRPEGDLTLRLRPAEPRLLRRAEAGTPAPVSTPLPPSP